jgi:putative nucleotidyltransferase with HDIG domain
MRAPLRVLHLEDDPYDVELVQELLLAQGIQCDLTNVDSQDDFRSALERGGYDLILADHSVPAFNGLSALALSRELAPGVPFIFLSGTLGEEVAIEALHHGATDYVLKQRITRLVPVIKRALHEVEERDRRKQAQVELERRNQELARLYRASDVLLSSPAPNLSGLAQTIVETILREFGQSNCSLFILEADNQRLNRAAVAGPYSANVRDVDLIVSGPGLVPEAVRTGQIINVPDVRRHPNYLPNWPAARSELAIPLKLGGYVIGAIDVQSAEPAAYGPDDEHLLSAFAERAALALENARLFGGLQRRTAELEVIARVSSALRSASSRAEILPVLLDEVIELFKADGALLDLRDPASGAAVTELGRGACAGATGLHTPAGIGLSDYVMATGQPYVNNRITSEPRVYRPELLGGVRALACIPLITHEQTTGALWVCRNSDITADEVRLLIAIGDIAANAIHRITLHEQTRLQLQRLAALHTVDIAISASLDLHFTLTIVLEQVTTQLGVDAADILLTVPASQTLEYAGGRGFRGSGITRSRLRLREGHAGRAAFERRIITIANLSESPLTPARAALLAGEEFVGYCAVPLVAKGLVKGVLEVFQRRPLHQDAEWMDFLETLAGQAAIAVDNASLFDGLQRSNTDLALAYDSTLEGWSRALDMRDKETEGHTERVTQMTMRLAREMGLGDAELVHVRRGALLHDIGKMGIPDSILLKPGPLTEEEWAIMRKHPTYAYEMLSPIAFLRPALPIPYCHHEKWDGTGYPRQLKGEAIPLSARIFAVVDVWDALRSDRPYRQGWLEDKVLKHIQSLAGTHFDPQVVAVFLSLVSSAGAAP